MKRKKHRVIVAMSGGVDSSMAAALLKKQGYDVVGIFMKLWVEKTIPTSKVGTRSRENICCSVEAATAARAVAKKLDIPFYVVNFADEFKKIVVDYYIKEYENGRTPNPCVICNRDIKGELLMKKMKELDADFLATGHYCRIKKDKNGYHLSQSKDKNKDQTYFLWTLTQAHLKHLLFPVGDLTKPEVRQIASKMNLPTAERRESQGICFIPDRDVSGFLKRHTRRLTKPGPIANIAGEKIGQHDGLINYTIGQRERLGLGGPKAYYVVKLDVEKNTLIVGDEKDLYRKDLIVEDLNWINPTTANRLLTTEIGARIRYGHPIESCKIKAVDGGQLAVSFTNPQRAITPGQSIVFYKDEEMLGGGIIA